MPKIESLLDLKGASTTDQAKVVSEQWTLRCGLYIEGRSYFVELHEELQSD